MSEGTIKKKTNRGFGFIRTQEGRDLFFHGSNLEGVTFDEIAEGQVVSYVEREGAKGPQAESVKLVS